MTAYKDTGRFFMNKLSFAIFTVAALAATHALAATPTTARVAPQQTISPGEVAATPEMWFYQQEMQQYLDPKMAVRRNAEFRADSRSKRLAAMKWFGLSNQRPRVSSDPMYVDSSAAWTSNNLSYPERWAGAYAP
jgi:hypothetical protein